MNVHNMKLHEAEWTVTNGDIGVCAIRVPGGWIYNIGDKDLPVFVPYSEEFKVQPEGEWTMLKNVENLLSLLGHPCELELVDKPHKLFKGHLRLRAGEGGKYEWVIRDSILPWDAVRGFKKL